MDSLKARVFIKGLIYDLNTVRLLLDNDRTKESLLIIDRILDKVDSFRASGLGHGLNDIFSKESWNKQFPGNMSFLDMRMHISQYAQTKTVLIDKDLEKIEYRKFVENFFIWSEKNISKIRHEIKSPLRKEVEKNLFCGALFIAGLGILMFLTWAFYTRNWGLYGEFYKGMNFEKRIASGINKTINFNNPFEMKWGIPQEVFSACWSGYLIVPQNLQYTFYLILDDGGRLFIDGKLVIDKWQHYNGDEFQNKIFLAKGRHPIQVVYFQDHYRAILKLYWEPDGGKKVIIPASYLRLSH